MANIAKEFEIIVKKEFAKKISKGTIIKAGKAAGLAAVDAIRERTNSGISYKGKRLPALRPLYKKDKKSGKALKNAKGAKTKFAAKGVPNHGRLTGQFFSAMKYKIKNTKITKKSINLIIELDVNARQAKKVDWLESSTGATRLWGKLKTPRTYSKAPRFIWGLSQQGAWKKREQKAIKDAFIKSFVKNAEVKVYT